MKTKLLEVIKLAQKNGIDPVTAIKDYLEEKDSHVTWKEARQIVTRLTKRAASGDRLEQ